MHLVCLGPKNGTFTILHPVLGNKLLKDPHAMTLFYLYQRLKVTAKFNEMFHSAAAAAADTHN